jgi:hypothetical protein
MKQTYTANIYSAEKLITSKSGDDIEQLYIWMLAQVEGLSGLIKGEIIDETTQEIVRKFKKAAVE